MSLRRDLAERMTRGADRLMPTERRRWTEAMRAELAHIDDDGAALEFAAGALQTAAFQSLAEATTMLRLGRWGVAAVAALLGLALLRLLVLVSTTGHGLPAILAVVAAGLAALHLAAGWTLARWRLAQFGAALAAVFVVLAVSALALVTAEAPPPHLPWLRALLIEQFAATAFFALAGVFFWRTRPLLDAGGRA